VDVVGLVVQVVCYVVVLQDVFSVLDFVVVVIGHSAIARNVHYSVLRYSVLVVEGQDVEVR